MVLTPWTLQQVISVLVIVAALPSHSLLVCCAGLESLAVVCRVHNVVPFWMNSDGCVITTEAEVLAL